jgi:hypothetical protein
MYSIDELIIAVFCCVDDLLKEVLQGGKVRAHGFAPKLSDSEVLTMEIVGESLKIDTDEQTTGFEDTCVSVPGGLLQG